MENLSGRSFLIDKINISIRGIRKGSKFEEVINSVQSWWWLSEPLHNPDIIWNLERFVGRLQIERKMPRVMSNFFYKMRVPIAGWYRISLRPPKLFLGLVSRYPGQANDVFWTLHICYVRACSDTIVLSSPKLFGNKCRTIDLNVMSCTKIFK